MTKWFGDAGVTDYDPRLWAPRVKAPVKCHPQVGEIIASAPHETRRGQDGAANLNKEARRLISHKYRAWPRCSATGEELTLRVITPGSPWPGTATLVCEHCKKGE